MGRTKKCCGFSLNDNLLLLAKKYLTDNDVEGYVNECNAKGYCEMIDIMQNWHYAKENTGNFSITDDVKSCGNKVVNELSKCEFLFF